MSNTVFLSRDSVVSQGIRGFIKLTAAPKEELINCKIFSVYYHIHEHKLHFRCNEA
jgi:hypothetical protein